MNYNDNAQKKDGKQLNNILCRKDLAEAAENGIKNCCVEEIDDIGDVCWFEILGGTKFWTHNQDIDYNEYFSKILSGVNPEEVVSFIIDGNDGGINFYAGISIGDNRKMYKENKKIPGIVQTFMNTYRAFLPGIDLKYVDELQIDEDKFNFGGIVTGYPIDYGVDNNVNNSKQSLSEIDNICRAMLGSNFTICITAEKVSGYTRQAIELLEDELNEYSKYVTITTQEAGTGRSVQTTNYSIQNYIKNLNKLCGMLKVGEASGTWAVNICYCSNNQWDFEKLGSVIKASYCSNNLDCFEPVQCIPLGNSIELKQQLKNMIFNSCVVNDEGNLHHPGGDLFSSYKYQTIMDSNNLAHFIALPRVEIPGYYLDEYVEFDMAVRGRCKRPLYIGNVCQGGRSYDLNFKNKYNIEIEDLTRHALIIGITGGGKTNTSKAILSEIYQIHNIPFLVIESAKREYIELMNLAERPEGINKNFSNLMLFTLGAEGKTAVRFRINPFEIAGEGTRKVSLQTHIDYLLATFKASFELYPPMPYVLETAVYEVYQDRGWDIIDNDNKYGWNEYPTLSDLYYKIDEVVERMNYDQEVKSNVKAALQARINSLRIGGKGAMLDTPTGVNIDKVLHSPVVMELEDIGDDDIKSFVIGVLLVQIYEYRKSKMGNGKKPLQHVLMIEEAHRLLKNVEGENNPRANSVEFFCNMLAEIRTFGQGIIIADQIPTKLATDTIKNTNLKIVHRTVMKEDREAIGFSMNMNDEQIEYLSSLRRGCAAIYAEGDNKPKLVMLPLKEDSKNADTSRESLLEKIRLNIAVEMPNYSEKYDNHKGCLFCRKRCCYYYDINEVFKKQLYKLDNLKTYIPEDNYSNTMSIKIMSILIKNFFENIDNFDDSNKVCILGYVLKYMQYDETIQYMMIKNYMLYLQKADS